MSMATHTALVGRTMNEALVAHSIVLAVLNGTFFVSHESHKAPKRLFHFSQYVSSLHPQVEGHALCLFVGKSLHPCCHAMYEERHRNAGTESQRNSLAAFTIPRSFIHLPALSYCHCVGIVEETHSTCHCSDVGFVKWCPRPRNLWRTSRRTRPKQSYP